MAFRNPVRSLPASAITGQIVGTQIAANSIATEHIRVNALDGRVITGTLIRTAATGDRIELTPDGVLLLYSGATSETAPGDLTTGINSDGEMQLGYLQLRPPGHGTHDRPELVMTLGPTGEKFYTMGALRLVEDELGATATLLAPTTIVGDLDVYEDLAVDGAAAVAGKLSAGNIRMGQVTITPVANTPTSVTVTGLGLAGTPRLFVTANTTEPGTRVTEVSVSHPTQSQFTIWLHRNNTTATIVYWFAIGA